MTHHVIEMPQKQLTIHRFSLLQIVIFTAMITLPALFLPLQAYSDQTGKVVATVNGAPIYQSDLACAVEGNMVRDLFSQPENPPTTQKTTKQVSKTRQTLNRLIDFELLYQESLKHRFPGLTEEAEANYNKEVKKLGGEKRLRSALSCNNMTPDQFRKVTFRNLSIKRFLDKVIFSKIVIEPADIRKYYEEHIDGFKTPESVHLRQIFIRVPRSADEQTRRDINEKALNIVRSARSGASFTNLARKYSEEPTGASKGGDMGLINKGNLHDTFATIVFDLEEGGISQPLKSRHGVHIFNVVKHVPASTRPLQEVRDRIHTSLRRIKAQEMLSTLLAELKEKADIQILLDR